MIDLESYLYHKTKSIINEWNEEDIYAISFFVYSNEAYTYQQFKNISEFAISYNTEKDCHNASKFCEERWNYAFWRQNTTHIINPHSKNDESLEILFQWYKENGIDNIGFEDYDNSYSKNMSYIGKGPIGYYELLTIISNAARRIQIERLLSDKFGNIPIIVHDLEYCWYIEEATAHANPNGEADVFLKSLRNGFQ